MYQLSLNEDQARVIARALDLFARIGVGQYEEITNVLRMTTGVLPQNIEQAERHLQEAKRLLNGHGPHASYGIHHPNVPDIYRQAFDLYQVIDHQLRQDNPSPLFAQADRQVFPASDKPLASIEVVA